MKFSCFFSIKQKYVLRSTENENDIENKFQLHNNNSNAFLVIMLR